MIVFAKKAYLLLEVIMKTLFFAFFMALGCKPSKLETTKNTHTGEVLVIEELEPVGMLPADDCQQIDLGDKACNFRLSDQNGDTWDLYEHAGQIIVLDFSAFWCYPCQMAAQHSQSIQDSYSNVQMVTVLIDGNTAGLEPTEDEINQWVQMNGITSAPVLMGSREKMFDPAGIAGYSLSGFPTYLYIDKEMKFYAGHTGFSEEYVRLKIEEGL